MKTAVEQLMIDSFGENFRMTVNDHQLNSFQKALEKEKEQMFYWFYGGGGLSATDDFREEFEKNYNQTYNQL